MVDSMEIGLTDEDLPNERSEDLENAISGIAEDADRPRIVSVCDMPQNVLVTTTTNLFGEQETLKATRIIIHEPPSLDALKNTEETITFNSLNRSLSVPERNFNWDPSVYEPVLPVRCRNIRGELHKSRFGSGSRGRSILVDGNWYTPSEFETLCGRGNSKDWKRSIRYAGRTLMYLIEEGILRPHATSCTCGACCEDGIAEGDGTPDASTGPVRLFTPYKRKKRQNSKKLKVCTNVQLSNPENIASAPVAEIVSAPITHIISTPVEIHTSEEISTNGTSNDSIGALSIPLITRDQVQNICPVSESVIVTPTATPQAPRCVPTALDFSEQKQWWQLEEMVKSAVRHVLELQKQVETVKNESAAAREVALHELRIQMENEKKEALNACHLEAQMTLSRAILEAKAEKEAAVEQAVEQARIEMQEKFQTIVEKSDAYKRCINCDREAFSECTGCHRVSYCSTFCQRKDWQTHRDECGENILTTQDCSELVDDCVDPTS